MNRLTNGVPDRAFCGTMVPPILTVTSGAVRLCEECEFVRKEVEKVS